METLIQRLMAWFLPIGSLPGCGDDALHELQRWVAAWMIQETPGLWPVPESPTDDPHWLVVAREGETLYRHWQADGVRVRLDRQSIADVDPTPGLRSLRRFGPLVEDGKTLVQFRFLAARRLFQVTRPDGQGPLARKRKLMLLPGKPRFDPETNRWQIGPGTLWLEARWLVPRASGYAGLRIEGGQLNLDRQVTDPRQGALLHIPEGVNWHLSVVPERPPAQDPSSANTGYPLLTLPSSLELGKDRPAVAHGPIALHGIGDAVTVAGDSVKGQSLEGAVAFDFFLGRQPRRADLRCQTALWKAAGESRLSSARWLIPLVQTDEGELGEAGHGGWLDLGLQGGLSLSLQGIVGRVNPTSCRLRVSADGLEWRAGGGQAAVELPLDFWAGATGKARFTADALRNSRWSWRFGQGQTVEAEGVHMEHGWDRPLDASGEPMAFSGVASLYLKRDEQGRHTAWCHAVQTPEERTIGCAFENLYLHLRPVRHTMWAGAGTTLGQLRCGLARLGFDVVLAQPMLPDPYAANWGPSVGQQAPSVNALALAIEWTGDAAQLRSHMADSVAFPKPMPLPDVPPDKHQAYRHYHEGLGTQHAGLSLLDLSGRAQRFGLVLEDTPPKFVEFEEASRMRWPLKSVRLLMLPQVHWEPLRLLDQFGQGTGEFRFRLGNGGPTLMGAVDNGQIPALPESVAQAIVAAMAQQRDAAVLFNLPFGLTACVRQQSRNSSHKLLQASLHQPRFDTETQRLNAAWQVRLLATGQDPALGPDHSARYLPGLLSTDRLRAENGGADAVFGAGGASMAGLLEGSFAALKKGLAKVPLHQVDLSGYGLSAFSHWRLPAGEDQGAGVAQVLLNVLVGRTSYELIQFHSWLWTPQCRVVRTCIIERLNSGNVTRYDSGWQAIDDGELDRHVEIAKGLAVAFRRIRNIRVMSDAPVRAAGLDWQRVLYDADLHLAPDPGRPAADRVVPVTDHEGYVLVSATEHAPSRAALAALAQRTGPVGGTLDARVRVGGSLTLQLRRLDVALAANHPGQPFVLAVRGAPVLPRAAQWSVVQLNGAQQRVMPLLDGGALPLIRRAGEADFIFRDPENAYDDTGKGYGLLMSTAKGRVLFPAPRIPPSSDRLITAPPLLADPTAMAQSGGLFPSAGAAFQATEQAAFSIQEDEWRIAESCFRFTAPTPTLFNGSGWGLERVLADGSEAVFHLGFGVAEDAAEWTIERAKDRLDVAIDGFAAPLASVVSSFFDATRNGPGEHDPFTGILLGKSLEKLQDIIDALKPAALGQLGFDADVQLRSPAGPLSGFIVDTRLELRIPKDPGARVSIGVGKFRGRLELQAHLRLAPGADPRTNLRVELVGDVQTGVLPPALYAGGGFIFRIAVDSSGHRTVELGMEVVASVGGSLIPGLVELEVTVTYGYLLIPQTLQPGVKLGLEGHAKLASGLLGLSFEVEAMAKIRRANPREVQIWVSLDIVATVQVAWLVEEDYDLHTQFQQTLPMEAVALLAGTNPLLVGAASAAL